MELRVSPLILSDVLYSMNIQVGTTFTFEDTEYQIQTVNEDQVYAVKTADISEGKQFDKETLDEL